MSEDLMTELAVERDSSSIIMVVGVGGAGGNAVNHMWNLGIQGVNFMVCNTDKQALSKSPVELKVLLGPDGLGAGNDPAQGREAAVYSEADMRRQLEINGTRMLFITAGMGGGTGTGASPVIAKIAREMGILTVAIVTTPDPVEGTKRCQQALRGVDELRQYVDSLLVINNEHITEIYGDLSLKKAFAKADDILASAAKGIAEIITVESDLVNVDFADVKRVMTNSGRAHLGVATAEGPNRADEATAAALTSPLLGHRSIMGAKNILLNISVSDSEKLKSSEVRRIQQLLQDEAAVQDTEGYQDANIIWGTSVKPQLGEALEVVVVITGFDEAEEPVGVSLPPRIKRRPEEVAEPANDLAKSKSVAAAPVQPDTVVLGKKQNRYENIEEVLQSPAYQRRHATFEALPSEGSRRREVLKSEEAAPQENSPKGGSLFTDGL